MIPVALVRVLLPLSVSVPSPVFVSQPLPLMTLVTSSVLPEPIAHSPPLASRLSFAEIVFVPVPALSTPSTPTVNVYSV